VKSWVQTAARIKKFIACDTDSFEAHRSSFRR